MPRITGACVVPVLALEVVITDVRLAKSVEMLIEDFSSNLGDIKTLTVVKLKQPEVVNEE